MWPWAGCYAPLVDNISTSSAALHCNSFIIHIHVIWRNVALFRFTQHVVMQLRWNPHFPHTVQLLHCWRPRGKKRELTGRKHIKAEHGDGRKSFKHGVHMKIGQAIFWSYETHTHKRTWIFWFSFNRPNIQNKPSPEQLPLFFQLVQLMCYSALPNYGMDGHQFWQLPFWWWI